MKPEVSIIIPVYNSQKTVERAIQSTLFQGVDAEVILVDDASSDGSADLIRLLIQEYTGRFQFVQASQNMGASGARNLGISSANADYIAFLDADDLWLPGKLEKQLAVIKAHEDVALVTCDSFKVSPQGQILSRGYQYRQPVVGASGWKALLSYNFIPTPTVLTRKSLIQQVGGFDTNLEVGEDLDLWIKIAKQGDIAVVDEVLTQYFDYSGSLMKRGGVGSAEYLLDMIIRHMDDPRLNHDERDSILSRRYFEIGLQCLGFGLTKQMNQYFSLAEKHGHSASSIRKIKTKYWIKKLLNK